MMANSKLYQKTRLRISGLIEHEVFYARQLKRAYNAPNRLPYALNSALEYYASLTQNEEKDEPDKKRGDF